MPQKLKFVDFFEKNMIPSKCHIRSAELHANSNRSIENLDTKFPLASVQMIFSVLDDVRPLLDVFFLGFEIFFDSHIGVVLKKS